MYLLYIDVVFSSFMLVRPFSEMKSCKFSHKNFLILIDSEAMNYGMQLTALHAAVAIDTDVRSPHM